MQDYSSFNKVQKIAAFLITLGPEAAAEVMKSFDNTQLELVCREIAALQLVEPQVQKAVVAEFSEVVFEGVSAAMGGVPFVQGSLERAKGSYAATALVNRCAPSANTEVGEEIRQLEGRQIVNLLKAEQPQTIAFIVSCMDPPKAAEIIGLLQPEVQEEVVERLGVLEPTPLDSIDIISRNLTRHFDRRATNRGMHRAGGVKACADILNALDKEMRKGLLSRLEARNPELGSAICKKVFSFEDIGRLAPAHMQRVMREVDSADLPIALKSAKPALVNSITAAMSKRAAESFKEELEALGPPRAKDVEAAQDRIIQVIRKLEEAEEISLDGEG